MWGAITKDFREFASTVAADATETLDSIDKTLDEPLVNSSSPSTKNNSDNDNDNDYDYDTTSEALIDPDTGIVISSVIERYPTRTAKVVPWKPPTEISQEEMKKQLVSCEDVFRDPLIVVDAEKEEKEESAEEKESEATDSKEESEATDSKDDSIVTAFLEGFDLDTKTEEISKLLETDATLKTTFSILSDSVTYKDFWTRYFYRIDDEERLAKSYSFYYQKNLEEVERELQAAAAEKAQAQNSAGMGGISSFFGGVVSKLTNDGESGTDMDTSGVVDESIDQTVDSEDGPVSAARTALGFLSSVAGGGGRPPFVMNTAVSDDDDDYDDDTRDKSGEEDDDDDSEVELGWDDDDDEDFDGLDDNEDADADADQIAFAEGDDRSETVDFKDAEKEGLLEELEQARAERDALQKTVEMQSEELKKAVAKTTASQPPLVQPPVAKNGDSESDDTEKLKLRLFEKDAELAALRSQIDDRRQDDDNNDASHAEHAAEVERLKKALATKDQEFEALEKQALGEQAKHQKTIDGLQESLSAQEQQLETLRKTKDDEASKLQHKVDEKQTEKEEMILALQSQIYALQRQLDEKPSGVEEVEELKQALSKKDVEIAALKAEFKSSGDEIRRSCNTAKETELEAVRNEGETKIQELIAQHQAATKSSTDESDKLRQEIEALQSERDRFATERNSLRPTSPGSSSTGVRVDASEAMANDASVQPLASIPTTPNAAVSLGLEPSENDGDGDGGDDDGWGDDW